MQPESRVLGLAIDASYGIARDEEWAPALLAGLADEIGFDAGVGLAIVGSPDRPGTDDVSTPVANHVRIVMHGAPEMSTEQAAAAFRAAPEDPLLAGIAVGRFDATTRMSDEVSLRRVWGTEAYAAIHGIYDVRYPAAVPLGTHAGRSYFIGTHRHSQDLSDAEVWRLDAVRPLIQAALAFRSLLREAQRQLGATEDAEEPNRHRLAGLTSRQRDVLTLVAAGWTNRRIGRRLGISERTVRKHVADIFDRLQVSSRAAAAARWTSSKQQVIRP